MFRVGIWLDYGDLLKPTNGAGVFVYQLVRGLLALDDPNILLIPRHGDRREVLDHVGCPHPRLRVEACVPGGSALSFHQARLCDIWVFPLPFLPWQPSVPYVAHVHESVIPQLHEQLNRTSAALIEAEKPTISGFFQAATTCVCTSAWLQSQVLFQTLGFSPARVRVVRPAVPADVGPNQQTPTAPLPIALERPYLFWPARFQPEKNHASLVTALRVLRDRYGEANLDLVFTGDTSGNLPDSVRDIAQSSGLSERVHVLGYVTRSELAALYQQAFATVICSSAEQGPLQLYESLQSECPVACASTQTLRDHGSPLGDAIPYFDPANPDSIARAILELRDNRAALLTRQQTASQPLWRRTWTDVAAEMLSVYREAAAVSRLSQAEQISRCARPWPETVALPARVAGPPELHLFMPVVYPGGIWQAAKDLVRDLVAINRERQELSLTFALPDDEGDAEALRALSGQLPVDRFDFTPITKLEALRLTGAGSGLEQIEEGIYQFMKGSVQLALRADAWFALSDRFRFPLLPARPYGVLVFDMIQRHAPETFPFTFFEWMERGMTPTIQRADMILTTSESTRTDVMEVYSLAPDRVRMVPIATAPARRFGGLVAKPVELPREPFLLQVTNIAPHKGVKVMLRGYARLKERLGDRTPLLVMCGYGTELLAPSSQKHTEDESLRRTRKMILDLGLREQQDVVFLGFVSDTQLLDLYQRAAVVVNAARYDNGSLCVIEGRYFGKPVVSSRYAASEEMTRRLNLPVHFFPVEDDQALAETLCDALQEQQLWGPELEQVRRVLDEPERTHRHYAEQVYRLLVDLARHGRNLRSPG